jgi:selenocysteine lyase/cysteine desulfurase
LGAGNNLHERIVDAMTSISEYEHGLATPYYKGVQGISGTRAWEPDFSGRARASVVSITLAKCRPAAVASALGDERIYV